MLSDPNSEPFPLPDCKVAPPSGFVSVTVPASTAAVLPTIIAVIEVLQVVGPLIADAMKKFKEWRGRK